MTGFLKLKDLYPDRLANVPYSMKQLMNLGKIMCCPIVWFTDKEISDMDIWIPHGSFLDTCNA